MSFYSPFASDFPALAGHIWLNCAHQGPLPLPAQEQAEAAVAWKAAPWELTSARFAGVPARVRAALGRLIRVPPEQVILANGASYGLHLIANGLPWRDGDEVLTMRGDFPSDVLPWLGLARRGVATRQLTPCGKVLTPEEVAAAITPRTRLLCLTWVHSLSGWAIDMDGIGAVCREHGVIFVLNVSQALGTRPFDASRAPVDAVVSAGWKWLLGPYATGFCRLRPELLEQLEYNQNYWLAVLSSDDLGRDEIDLTATGDVGARRYDVFSTANFFNFAPWGASLEWLLDHGIEHVQRWNDELVQGLVDGLDRSKLRITSPASGPQRSTLVFVEPNDRSRAPEIHAGLSAAGVHVALRAGALRLSPHLYNSARDIESALERLHGLL